MALADSLDAFVSVYKIDVHGKKWHWPHYINTVDILKRTAFKVFRLVNPDAKIDFLAFTRRVAMYYLKAAKVGRDLPPSITYPKKGCWLETQQFQKMTETRKTTLLRNFLQNNVVSPQWPRTWHSFCKVGICMQSYFKAFHKWISLMKSN